MTVTNLSVTRPEDMSPDGSLTLFMQDDGDIIVTVKEADEKGLGSSVEFCLYGTRSRNTGVALRLLMGAMQEDAGQDANDAWLAYRSFRETEDPVFEDSFGRYSHSLAVKMTDDRFDSNKWLKKIPMASRGSLLRTWGATEHNISLMHKIWERWRIPSDITR